MRNRQTVAAVVKVYFVARRRIKIRDPLLYFTSTLGRKSTEVSDAEPVISVLLFLIIVYKNLNKLCVKNNYALNLTLLKSRDRTGYLLI